MDERTDSELLREYAKTKSEAAFSAVLSRHINFVYSVALRVTGDPHLAEDVTQKVFVVLAASARKVSGRVIISGWLHRTTRNLASNAVRTEVRRRVREQEAAQVQIAGDDPLWKKLAPVLDCAIAKLSDVDRDVVLLRFFQRKTAAQIGARMRLSEHAAQKRVNRAVERLRAQLAREGVSLTGVALAGVLTTEGISAAPASLIAATSAAALATTPIKSSITAACLEIISMTKIKTAAVAALVVAGVVTPFAIQHRMLKHASDENRALRKQVETYAAFGAQRDELSNQLAQLRQAQSLSKAQISELMRLRSEVGVLRRDSQELAKLRTERKQTAAPAPEAGSLSPFLPADSWANVGAHDAGGALQTFLWAGKHRATNLMADLIRVQRDPEIPASEELDEKFARTLIAASAWFSGSLEAFRVVATDNTRDNMTRLTVDLMDKKGKTTTHKLHFVQQESQWFPVIHVWLQDNHSVQAALDVPAKFQ